MVRRDPLLFPVFDYLRRHGVPLGVSEYTAAVRALRQGVGLEDAEQFRRFCRLLWAKSREDQELFDVAFAELVEPRLQYVPRPEPPPMQPEPVPPWRPPPPRPPSELEPREEERAPRVKEKEKPPRPEPGEVVAFQTLPVHWSSILETYPADQPATYHLTPRLPLGRRDMAGAWRHLRQLQRTGPDMELDVEATIDDICRTGYFLQPRLRPSRRNRARLVVLLDQEGSMAPFLPLVETLVQSIVRGGLLGRVSLYYFHDCPEGVLYEQPNLSGGLSLEEILAQQVKGASLLVVSDGGAARGDQDKERVEDTRAFLRMVNAYTYLYAWLNPVPADRWKSTTAQDLAGMVPMFPLDREGLNDAVNILRGQPFPPWVSLDA